MYMVLCVLSVNPLQKRGRTMCKYCENIDNVIDIACEKAKKANGTDPLKALFFPIYATTPKERC